MKLLKDYDKLKQKIYDYFGYLEEWHVYPIDDMTDFYWQVGDDHRIVYFDDAEFNECGLDPRYSSVIIGNILRGKDYTMIKVDTETDGNKFLQIFDNRKQIK